MSLVVRWVVAVALALLSAPSWAQLHYFTLIDSDSNAATGCSVTLPISGTVSGIEQRLTATVSETVTPQVIQFTLENCTNGSFGAPVTLPGTPYPVGLNNGDGGADVVEQAVAANLVAPFGGTVRLYFAAQGPTSDDLLGSVNGPPALFDIQPGGSTGIPSLSGWGLLVFALLLFFALSRHRSHFSASAVSVLLVGTLVGIAWAAGFYLDGQIGDWQGVPAIGSDAQGDSTPTTDIVTAFAAQEGGNLFFRTDIANAETTPSSNRAPNFTSTPITTANVASSYNYAVVTSDPDGNGLTLTAPTLPAWLTFTPGTNGAGTLSGTPSPGDAGPHAVVLRVTDNGTPSLSADQAFTVTVGGATNPAPVLDLNGLAAGIDFAATFIEDGGAVVIVDPANLTVSDPDSPNLASAMVTITNLLDSGQETLAVSAATVAPNTPITAAFNAATGVLTLSGSATLTQYQAALRTVTYNNTAAAPTAAPARAISFTVSDGSNSSAPATATVTVTNVNDAPSFTAANPPAVNEDSGPQTVNGWVTAFNTGPADESAQTALAYTVSNMSNAALFSSLPSVSTNGNLSYTPASNAFGTATFQVQVQDSGGTANGGQDTSAPQTFTITVNGINDQPSFTASNPPAANENAGAQTVAGWATFNPGNPQESTQTVLAYTVSNIGNTALFSVQPSVAANGNLTYTPVTGANGTSTFSVAVQDNGGTTNGGVDTSAVQTFTITVNPVNDPPTITGQNLVSTAEDTARTIAFADLTVTDLDNAYPTGFTLTVSDGANYTRTGNTITPALDFAGTLTVPVIVNDGADNSNTFNLSVTVTAVNDAPVNTVPGAQNTGEDVVLVLNAANSNLISISDVDVGGSDLAVTLSVTTGTLSLSGTAALIFTVGDGAADATMTFTGALTAINAALNSLSFQPPLDTTGNSTLTLTTDDQGNTGAGGGLNDIDTVTITITAVNDAPVIANLAGDTLAYTQGEPASVIDQNDDASASDIDSTDFDTGTLTVSLPVGVVTTEDQLGIRNQGSAAGQIGVNVFDVTYSGVTIGSFSGGAGGGNLVVTFNNPSADATAVSALLRNITYLNSNNTNPSTTARTARFVLTDGDGGTSIDYDTTITVALNDPPVVTTNGGVTAFTENGPAVIVDGALTVTDTNDTDLESATVTITNLLNAGVETLSATTGGTAITATYAAPTLTLTGTDTVANYQTVLRSVTYNNTSQNPNEAARIIRFVANDGSADSAAATKTVSVTGVNDAPSFTASNPPAVNEDVGGQSVANWATFSPGPADESTQTVLNYTVSGVSNAALFSVQPAVDSTGSLTYTPAANANGTSNFTVTVRDNGGTANGGVDTSTAQTFVITVNPVNDAPSFTPGSNQTVNEDAPAQSVAWATAINDGDPELTQTLTFNVSNDNNALFSTQPAINPAGTLTYTPAANANGSATITVTLSDNGDTANGGVNTSASQSFTITVNAVNDPPVAQNKTGFSAQANMAVAGIDAGLLAGVTDADAGVNGCNPTFVVASITANSGGTVSNVNLAAGTFDFEPTAGFTGTAIVNYTVQDNGCPLPAATSASATIGITVNGPVIWFVTPAAGTSGTGTLADPFTNLASANTAKGSNTNHRIFVYNGITTAGTGVSLTGDTTQAGAQWLIGQGASGVSFDTLMGIAPPAGTPPRPGINGARPTIQGTLTLNGNNVKAQGFNLTIGTATGMNDAAGAISGVSVSEVSVASTTGTAVNLSSLNGTVSLTSVSANGAANGIALDTTTGSFTVTGDGGGSNNGSGGTIQNTTAEGIVLNNTDNVSLGYMNINNSGTDSIRITDINGFTLNRSNISDAAGTTSDKAIDIGDFVTGTPVNGNINITNSVLGPAAGSSPHDILAVGISAGTSTWAITGSTFRRTGNSGINWESRGNSVATVTVTNNSFAGGNVAGGSGSPSARGIFVNTLDDSVITDFVVQNNSFTNNNIHTDMNQQNDTDPVGSHTFHISTNTPITGARSHAMNIFAAAGSFAGTFNGTVQSNPIGNAAVDGSGSEIGNGIRLNANGGTTAAMLIDANPIRETPNGRGIEVIGRNGLGTLDATITNEDVDHYNLAYPIGGGAAFPLGAIYVNASKGGATGIVGFRVRSDVRINIVPAAGGALPAASEVTGTYLSLEESIGTNLGGILELVDNPAGPGGQTPTQQLQSTNTGDAGANAGVSLIPGPINTPP